MAARVCSTQVRNKLTDVELDLKMLTLDLEEDCIGALPSDFIRLLFLNKPGDFCLSISSLGNYRLTVRTEKGNIVPLDIQGAEGQYYIKGMALGPAATVGNLCYGLRTSTIDVLSGVIGEKIVLRRMIGKESLKKHRIITKENVITCEMTHADEKFRYYSGIVNLNDERVKVQMKEFVHKNGTEWRKYMYEEIRKAIVIFHHQLPVREAIGLLLEGEGKLMYRAITGSTLSSFLRNEASRIDVGLRIMICRSLSSMISELHSVEIYHGALTSDDFFVHWLDDGPDASIQILLNSSEGLEPKNEPKHVCSSDFSLLAPEVTWTRQLSPFSEVYNLGKLFLSIMSLPVKVDDPNTASLRPMQAVLKKCTSENPRNRPNMDGLFIAINQIAMLLTKTDSWTLSRN